MAASVSGKTGASGTISSLRDMVMGVSLVPGEEGMVELVATMLCAVAHCATSSRHAAGQQRRMRTTGSLVVTMSAAAVVVVVARRGRERG